MAFNKIILSMYILVNTQNIKAKSLPEGKIVGDIIEKDTPSEGMLILNKKTNKWDFVPKSKEN